MRHPRTHLPFLFCLFVALAVPAVAGAHGQDACLKDCGDCRDNTCGNGKCEVDQRETCLNCEKDCGKCDRLACGNGKCEHKLEEWCFFCPQDCGKCPVSKTDAGHPCNGKCEYTIGEVCNLTFPTFPDAGPADATSTVDGGSDPPDDKGCAVSGQPGSWAAGLFICLLIGRWGSSRRSRG